MKEILVGLRNGLLVAVLAATAACTSVKEDLGMVKEPPDEFRVTPRAPLSMPPQYSLRPPQPGQTRPQEGTTQQQARRTVFRIDDQAPAFSSGPPADATRSPGERAFLAAAGTQRLDPNIRDTVDQETDRLNEQQKSLMDHIIFWRDPLPSGVVVDAPGESERLRQNASLGRLSTDGQTPVIERRERALLEDIF